MTPLERRHASERNNAQAFFPRVDWLRALVFVFALIGLLACNAQTPPVTPIATTIAPPVATLTPINSLLPASPTLTPALGSTETITLTVWAPEEFAPGVTRGGQVLQHQVDEFTHAHPGIHITFVLKNRYGKGGLLDFLTKVQALLPEQLPDLALLDSRELDAAADANLLQPLDKDLPAGAYADLLPPAQAVARYNGVWDDLPLTLDLQHLAYNAQVVHDPPATWDQLVAGGAPFAFPADSEEAFWLQYLDNNGRLSSPQTPGALDIAATTAVFTFYQRARAANLIPDSVFGLKTVNEVWQIFAAGQAPLAQVEANDFFAASTRVANANYAPLPTREGRATTLAYAWSYVIITHEATRHAAAAQFLNWMDEPARVAEWASAAHLIPARRSAFAQSVTPRAYADFLLQLTNGAIVAPTFAQRAPYAAGIRSALQMVLRGQATPGEAALKAVQPVTQ